MTGVTGKSTLAMVKTSLHPFTPVTASEVAERIASVKRPTILKALNELCETGEAVSVIAHSGAVGGKDERRYLLAQPGKF